MGELDTSEAVTKALRSKTTSLDQIIQTANNLLDNNINVYLPNKDAFIFDLVCDRLNDNSTFKSWKFNPATWKLILRVWTVLDKPTRTKTFNKVKFIDLLVTIFRSDADESLLQSVFEFIKVVKQDSFIDIDENLAIALLSSYVDLLLKVNSPLVQEWSPIIIEIYQLPQHIITYSTSKKTYTKFINECVPGLLKYLSGHPSESFSRIIVNGLFIDSLSSYFKQNIEHLLKNDELTAESVTLLFKITIDTMSVKNIKLCEELFTSITKTTKFNGLAEQLLSTLAKVNKSLSNEFFKSIYVEEVDSKTDINWKLVTYLFKLDIELAMENSSKIFSKLSSKVDKDDLLSIGKAILDSYSRGRELHEFFMSVWISAIKQDKFWTTSSFVDLVAGHINILSSSQLIKLIGDLFTSNIETDSLLPAATAIIKGLIMCPLTKIEAIKPLILEHSAFFANKSQQFWEIRYYLLCLYGDEQVLSQTIFDNAAIGNKYFFYTLFRYIEITSTNNSVHFQSFIDFLSKNPLEVSYTLERWIVLINTFFTKEQVNELTHIIFKNYSYPDLLKYFDLNGEYFFEQKHLTNGLVLFISEELTTHPKLIQIIQLIPIQCFEKSPKKKLLESLYELATESKSANLEARLSIRHLLKQPSFRSKLEMNFDKLLLLLETATPESKDVSFDIAKLVVGNHLQQISTKENKEYFLNAFKDLNKFFATYKPGKSVPPRFEISVIFISTIKTLQDLKPQVDELVENFMKAAKSALKYLSKKKSIDSINWYISSMVLVLDICKYDANVQELVKLVGKQMYDSNEIRTNLFKLVTRIAEPTLQDAVHIVTLFFALDSAYDLKITHDLTIYLKKLSFEEEIFDSIFSFVVDSSVESTPANMSTFVKLFTCLISCIRKEQENGSHKLIQFLSMILSNFTKLDYTSLDDILVLLKSSLTTQPWLFNQYALETILTLITKTTFAFTTLPGQEAVTVYVHATQVMSHILLFHRYKLSSRHHLVMSTFVSLLEALSYKNHNKFLSSSKEAAASYSRLLSNLCEPSNSSGKENNSLNTSSALIKRALRRHVPMLLVNYVYFNLKYNFQTIVNDEIISGIYSIFDVLSQTELQLVNSSLDIPGKTYYSTLYSNYKEHGKWKDN